MKSIVLSVHCKMEIFIRNIHRENIIETIRNPDKISEGRGGAVKAWKKLGSDGLVVVYTNQKDRIFVITAYPKISI